MAVLRFVPVKYQRQRPAAVLIVAGLVLLVVAQSISTAAAAAADAKSSSSSSKDHAIPDDQKGKTSSKPHPMDGDQRRDTPRDADDVVGTNSSTSVAQCLKPCQGIKARPVCASDGATYSTKCELRRLRDCFKQQLKVISKGRCPGETKCQEERRAARYELLQRPTQDTYIPECLADGSFMQTQCHNGTGYCWCVRSDGKPIPGSSVEGNNTNCQKFDNKRLYMRRVDALTGKKPRTTAGSKHRRGVRSCSPYSRSIFNRNLLKRFNEEYARAPRPAQQTTAAVGVLPKSTTGPSVAPPPPPPPSGQCQGDAESCAVRRVVEWKFSELDLDKDGELKRKELKTLRYLVNKIVEPHACALSFLDYCDWDNNKKVSLQEWSKCLRVALAPTNVTSTTNNAQQPVSKPTKVKTKQPPIKKTVLDRPVPRIKPGSPRPQKTNIGRHNSLAQKLGKQRNPLNPLKETFYDLKSRTKTAVTTTGPRSKHAESEQKDRHHGSATSETNLRLRPCDEERQKAKEMDRADPDGHIYIPECEPSGLFRKVQCHNVTGYCWCVDEKTGIPIPGISTQNVTPDCSDIKTNNLKGCPFPTKKRFLTELLDQVTQEMVERVNNGTSASQLGEPDPDQSIEERAVRWKLATLDTNNNGALEKGELKDFREEITRLKGDEKYMRKCRRNFLQFCDQDNDSKITADEWVNCMGLNEQGKNLPENPKRKGTNPFSRVLT